MAYNLETARQAALQRGERPPGGEQPGTPGYDDWVMRWFEAGLNAGDPDLVRRAGGLSAEEGEGGYLDFGSAAGPDQWLGKRKPTPRELRRYAQMTGQSEDYQRFDDRQLAAWISKSWDPAGGHFVNDFGDVVEKPTESGTRSLAAGAATGERGVGPGGGGVGGGLADMMSGLGGKMAAPTNPAIDPTTTRDYLLNSPLAQMLANQGGFLSQYDKSRGDQTPGVKGGVMGGGSIWWAPTPSQGMGRPSGLRMPLAGSPATPGMTAVAGTPRPAAPLNTPVTNASPLVNTLAPLQGQTPAGGIAGAGASPLAAMLNPYQKRKQGVNRWF